MVPAVVVLPKLSMADWMLVKPWSGPTRRVPWGQPASGLRVGAWQALRFQAYVVGALNRSKPSRLLADGLRPGIV